MTRISTFPGVSLPATGGVSALTSVSAAPAQSSAASAPASTAGSPPGGLAVTVVRGGQPALVVDGVRVRDGAVQDDPGPVTSQDYARTASGGVTDPRGDPTDSEVSYAGCGQATAAVILQRYGHFSSEEAADDHMRVPGQLGGSIYAVADYFRMRGLEARVYNGGSWEDLRRAVELGFGVSITLTHETALHTMTVTGILTGEDGREYIQVMDVNGGGTRLMEKEAFLHQWDEAQLLGLGGLRTGITRTYTVVGPPGSTLPEGGSVWGELNAQSSLATLDGFNDLLNAFRYFGEAEVLGGVARLLDGTIQLAVQAPATILQAAGAGLEWLCGKPVDFALGILRDPQQSFWAKLGAVLLLILTWPLQMVGTGLRYLGQLVGAATGAVARLLSMPFSKLADWAHQDDDARSAARYADPAGTPRERRNWERLRDETPVVPGKRYLIDELLSGNVSDGERDMVLRVLSSCADRGDRIDPATLRQLIDAVGVARLDDAFAGSPQEARWQALRADAFASATPIAPPQPLSSAPNAPRAAAPRLALNRIAPRAPVLTAGLARPRSGVATRRA